jgi:hypothetical protein
MGCHTWFYKLTTVAEIENSDEVKEYAEDGVFFNLYELASIPNFNMYLSPTFHRICIQRNPQTRDKNRKYTMLNNKFIYYARVHDFHDSIRVKNYPAKTLHNFRQMRRWLGKRFYNLTEEQKLRMKLFWKTYPKGMIDFG